MIPYSVTALLWNGSKVLAVSRKNNHADLGLPGGKIESGETPEEAIIREVREETSLILTNVKKIFERLDHVENDESRSCCCYMGDWVGDATSMEGARVEWVNPNDLMTITCSFASYNYQLFQVLFD